jgi:hypothetical protein
MPLNIHCLSGDLLINEYLLQKITNNTHAHVTLAIEKQASIDACRFVLSQSMSLDEWNFHEHRADAF